MNQETIFSIMRSILAVFGALLMGKAIGPHVVDQASWNVFVGGALGVISVVWSFSNKTITLEGFQGALRQTVTFAGSFLLAKGIFTPEVFGSIVAAIIAISPIIYSYLSKLKSQKIAKGQLGIADLNGVKKVIPIEQLQPVLKTPPAA